MKFKVTLCHSVIVFFSTEDTLAIIPMIIKNPSMVKVKIANNEAKNDLKKLFILE